jgi:HEAT repeat protein
LMGNIVITPLLYSMLESNTRQYQSAEDILLFMGKNIGDFLIEKINDKNYLIRALAIELLGKLKCRKAIEPIKKALNENISAVIRKASLEALEKLGSE